MVSTPKEFNTFENMKVFARNDTHAAHGCAHGSVQGLGINLVGERYAQFWETCDQKEWEGKMFGFRSAHPILEENVYAITSKRFGDNLAERIVRKFSGLVGEIPSAALPVETLAHVVEEIIESSRMNLMALGFEIQKELYTAFKRGATVEQLSHATEVLSEMSPPCRLGTISLAESLTSACALIMEAIRNLRSL